MTFDERVGRAILAGELETGNILMPKSYRECAANDDEEAVKYATEYWYEFNDKGCEFMLDRAFANYKAQPSETNKAILISLIQGYQTERQ